MFRSLSSVIVGVAINMIGCGDNMDATIGADVACREQAELYCSRLGDASDACIDRYQQYCGASPDRRVDARAQEQCLADLEVSTCLPTISNAPMIPDSCGAIFAVPLKEVCSAPEFP